MAPRNKPQNESEQQDAPETGGEDLGQAEAQEKVDEAQRKGYIGVKVDPRPNSEYSLESGPDSPGAAEARRDINVADLGEEE